MDIKKLIEDKINIYIKDIEVGIEDISSLIEKVELDYLSYIETEGLLDFHLNKLKRSRENAKSNWVKRAKRTDSNIISELGMIKFMLTKVDIDDYSKEYLQLKYGSIKYDECESVVLKEYLEWANRKDNLLCEFPGFENLFNKSKLLALKNDILYLYNYFYNESNKLNNTNKELTRIPSIFANLPMQTSSQQRFLTDKELEEINDIEKFKSTEKISRVISNEQADALIMSLEKELYLKKSGVNNLDILTQIAFVKAIKDFNHLTFEIVNYFYTNAYNIISSAPIETTLREIALALGKKPSKVIISNIKDELNKISSMSFSSGDYEGQSINGGLLSVGFYKEDKEDKEDKDKAYKVEKVRVYLGDFLKELMKLGSTFNFDRKIMNHLSKDAQRLAVFLQNHRLNTVLSDIIFKETLSAEMLFNALKIYGSNLSLKRKRLEKALNELILANLVVQSYKYSKNKYLYDIEYIPLQEQVVESIKNKTFVKNNLIDRGLISELVENQFEIV